MVLLMKPLFVVDTSVICHNILTQLRKVFDIENPGNYEAMALYTQLSAEWIKRLGFLSNKPDEAIMIWVADNKPYWRLDYCSTYKHGRSQPPQIMGEILRFVKSSQKALEFHRCEADDVASLVNYVYRNQKPECVGNLYYLTVDTDWLGFCDEDTFWIDTGGYEPRVRGVSDVRAWIERKMPKKKVWRIPEPFTADMVWKFKSYVGDSSDNLPGDYRWSHLIDLNNPPIQWQLWRKAEAVRLSQEAMTRSYKVKPSRDVEKLMFKLGCVPPVLPVPSHQFPPL